MQADPTVTEEIFSEFQQHYCFLVIFSSTIRRIGRAYVVTPRRRQRHALVKVFSQACIWNTLGPTPTILGQLHLLGMDIHQ